MNSGLRRLPLVGISALAFALAAAAATRSAPPPKQVSCGQSLVIVLFWPHGHGSIPSVGFSAERTPHLEIYKYGTHGYPRRNFLVYAAATAKSRFAAACKPKIGGFPGGSISSRITARRARAFSCRLPTNTRVYMRSVKGRFQIDIGAPGSRVISTKLREAGSTLDFSRAACNPGPPPG